VAEETGITEQQSFAVSLLVNRSWWLLLLAVVAAFATWSLSESIQKLKEQHNQTVTESARNIFRLVELSRFWNASHGGVYVPTTATTPPNPYLMIPERDLTTTDGRKLTMVNPAYMTRQMSELLALQSRYSFRLTSLKPIRPANKADEWETRALQQFEAGVKEVSEKVTSANKELFRYMAPLVVKQPCLNCHAVQGYKLGDIRGGISVTFHDSEFINESDELVIDEVIKYVVAYLVFAVVFLLLINKVRAQFLFMQETEHRLEMTVQERTRDLEHMATHDALTGLHNRNALSKYLNDECARTSRYNHNMSIFMLDLDHFKNINDNYSHLVGDRVLVQIASVLKNTIRATDFSGRYGGEEFVVVLPETSLDEARELAQRLLEKIRNTPIEVSASLTLSITTSIGVASYPDHADNPEELLKKADMALYQAKENGRDRIEVATERE